MTKKNTDPIEPPTRILKLSTLVTKHYFSPKFFGLEQLDLDRPALWVGNHTIYGLLDVPLMVEYLARKGVAIRSLGDHGHFKVPIWSQMVTMGGAVEGTRENCRALMESGQHVLVFPGGAREVMRRKGEEGSLVWKKRTGFARMAIEHGYDIIPFACHGPDESLDIVWDANDMKSTPVWQWLDSKLAVNQLTRNGDMIPPLAKGLGVLPIPRPQRFYFGFGERIPTAGLAGHADDDTTLWALREKVAEAIYGQLDFLAETKEQEIPQKWGKVRRWLAGV